MKSLHYNAHLYYSLYLCVCPMPFCVGCCLCFTCALQANGEDRVNLNMVAPREKVFPKDSNENFVELHISGLWQKNVCKRTYMSHNTVMFTALRSPRSASVFLLVEYCSEFVHLLNRSNIFLNYFKANLMQAATRGCYISNQTPYGVLSIQ